MHQLVRQPLNQSILDLTIAFAKRVDKGQDGPYQVNKHGRTRLVVRLIISYLRRDCYGLFVARFLLTSQPAASLPARQPACQPGGQQPASQPASMDPQPALRDFMCFGGAWRWGAFLHVRFQYLHKFFVI